VAGETSVAVLDASALLALLLEEPGADRVERAITGGVCMSAVNWAEALSRLAERGDDIDAAASQAHAAAAGSLELIAFDDQQARETARLRTRTRSLGLSLADRAALALARLRGLPVLTTDRAWRSLRFGIKIEVIR
jgi:PIN domain nuclease of toxin-antitoxin system